ESVMSQGRFARRKRVSAKRSFVSFRGYDRRCQFEPLELRQLLSGSGLGTPGSSLIASHLPVVSVTSNPPISNNTNPAQVVSYSVSTGVEHVGIANTPSSTDPKALATQNQNTGSVPSVQEFIFPTDERTIVSNTTSFWPSAVGRVWVQFPDGTQSYA